MTSRERVLEALSHREPDRVPLDFGSTGTTGITIRAYERLKAHLDIEAETVCVDRMQQLARVDEKVLETFRVDTRGIEVNPPDKWQDKELPDGYMDEWGVVRTMPEGGYWYDIIQPILGDEATEDDLEEHSFWPAPGDPGRCRGLEETAKSLYEDTEYALIGIVPGPFITQSQYMRGFEGWFRDTIEKPEFIGALMDRCLDLILDMTDEMLHAIGDYIQIIFTGDDIGVQEGPMISPDSYRRLLKPRQRRLFKFLKANTKAKVLYHSCGSVHALLPDLIDLDVDCINPVQVNAAKMDSALLKADFGDKMSFWGAIDTARVLPGGTTDQIRAEVKKRIADLAPGGGYVLNSVHNIQAEVPPENVIAMFEAGLELGGYPIESPAG